MRRRPTRQHLLHLPSTSPSRTRPTRPASPASSLRVGALEVRERDGAEGGRACARLGAKGGREKSAPRALVGNCYPACRARPPLPQTPPQRTAQRIGCLSLCALAGAAGEDPRAGPSPKARPPFFEARKPAHSPGARGSARGQSAPFISIYLLSPPSPTHARPHSPTSLLRPRPRGRPPQEGHGRPRPGAGPDLHSGRGQVPGADPGERQRGRRERGRGEREVVMGRAS